VFITVYLIQHYVIKIVSNLQQVSGFLWVLRFHPPIKLAATEILLKMVLNTINLNQTKIWIFSDKTTIFQTFFSISFGHHIWYLSLKYPYYVSPSNEGRHIVLVWFFLLPLLPLLLSEACPDHNFFVFPDRSMIFGMWVHDLKAVCRIP
jgi:hypothetical protein